MSPLSSWWFYAPFALFILAALFAGARAEKNKDDLPAGLSVLAALIWSLVNAARYLIYIIPFSGPVISSPYFAAPAIAIGLLLYRLRGKYPLFYGSTEVLVAILVIFVSIGTDTANPLNKIVGILGGIYIFIRGLDNVDKGLPHSWRGRWNKWFPKRHTPTIEQNVKAQSPEATSETPPPATK